MGERHVDCLRVPCNSTITSLWEPISAAFSRGLGGIQIRSSGRKCMKVRKGGANSSGAKFSHLGSRKVGGEGGEDFLGRRADLLATLGEGEEGRWKFRRDKENLRDRPRSAKLTERLWLHNICLFNRRGRT
jgi:hypothetical protein